MKKPYVFDEFFASGFEEVVSPFLTSTSRSWGKNLSLRISIFSSFLLVLAFALSFFHEHGSNFLLCFIYFMVGVPALINAIEDLLSFDVNINVLMTLAAFVAILMGSAVEGALLLVLFSLSHALECMVSAKAKGALHNLNHIAPKFASLIDSEGHFYEKSVREIEIGDIVSVKNGEIIPLDGTIKKGTSSLNLSHLTGESLPVKKTVGDQVPAGARNLEEALFIVVTRTSQDSTLSRIVKLISEAVDAKPKIQNFLDRFGSRYASSIIALTFAFSLLLPLFFHIPFLGMEGSIYRSLAFLIAASPCALIIATPTAYLSAISACAKKGILLKGGITLDGLSSCSNIAFDKTGTLTTGKLTCTRISPEDEQGLSVAYGLERHVVHPIAQAIEELARKKGIAPEEIDHLETVPGEGLTGMLKGVPVAIGNPKFIQEKCQGSLYFNHFDREENEMVCALLVGTKTYLFYFSDQIRENMGKTVDDLKERNHLSPVILTGDHPSNANSVAKKVGISLVFSELSPKQKLEKVAVLSDNGGLAMVGDGVNDAPALARATVGISMGKIGSATAVDASDVVLLNDDVHNLSWLFFKAHQTKKVVKQNLSLALSVICFATIPALIGLVPLWAAVILHEGGTVLVGLNSLRLLRK